MTTRGLLLLVCVAGCEHVDNAGSDQGPNLSGLPGASTETPLYRANSPVERVEPPPPPTAIELRRMRLGNWFALLSMDEQRGVRAACRWNVENPCGAILRGGVDPRPTLLAALGAQEQQLAHYYCDTFQPAGVCNTPLVVAFEGEAIQFVDHWPTASTPWLALDRDGDGAITSRAELFGDATVLPGGRIATNGFEALAPLDDNGDGVVDARDPMFGRLLLWADRDGDRRSSPSELRPAYEVLLALPLANERRPRCTDDGDCEGERGAMSWRAPDGSVRAGAVIDVYLPGTRAD